jgi:hypothetical protein
MGGKGALCGGDYRQGGYCGLHGMIQMRIPTCALLSYRSVKIQTGMVKKEIGELGSGSGAFSFMRGYHIDFLPD